MSLSELKDRYLLPNFTNESANCLVSPLVDAESYNAALKLALAKVGNGTIEENQAAKEFILVHNWWLGLHGSKYLAGDGFYGYQVVPAIPYFLDGPPREGPVGGVIGGQERLLDVLIAKARKGVDVRVMGWMPFGVTSKTNIARFSAQTTAEPNAGTLVSIAALRKEPLIGLKAITDEISHVAGSSHLKMFVLGSTSYSVAFTGGIDLVTDRWAPPFHPLYKTSTGALKLAFWHDVVVQVEGDAVAFCYQWFSTIWEEIIARPPREYKFYFQDGSEKRWFRFNGHSSERDFSKGGTPSMPAYPRAATPTTGIHFVQSLRTAPQARFSSTGGILHSIKTSPPLQFAPNGLQEFQQAIRKAISGAESYIYFEDAVFYSQEIMSYLHDALVAKPQLKIILLTGGKDPNDPGLPDSFGARALYRGLIQGRATGGEPGSELTGEQQKRVRFYHRRSEEFVGVGRITAVAPIAGGKRLTLEPGFVAPGATAATPLLPYKDGKNKDGTDHLVTALEPDVLFTVFNAQVRIGSDAFPIVSHPRIAQGQSLVVDVRPGAFDIAQKNEPKVGPCDFYLMPAILVHAKLILIDDVCAIVGSANATRRSLYTDLEHSIAFVSPTDVDATVPNLRCALWADHFLHSNASDFVDLQTGLHAWNSQWGTSSGSLPGRPPSLLQRDLPLADPDISGQDEALYDTVIDVDSREDWGGLWNAWRLKK